MNAELFAFVLYFVMLVGVGLFFFFKGRKKANEKEYFLGGRSMGPWVTAMSAQASDMSAWLLDLARCGSASALPWEQRPIEFFQQNG